MKVVRSKTYTKSLQGAMTFIAKDSKSRALQFKDQLDIHIDNLDNMPYKFRKSIRLSIKLIYRKISLL